MSTLNLTRVEMCYRQNPNPYKVFKLSKVHLCWVPWVCIKVFKNTDLWLSFYSDPGRFFSNWRHIHISAYIDTCQHYVKEDVCVGNLQSAGSHLWKLVAGKTEEGSDLWPSTPSQNNFQQFRSLLTCDKYSAIWWLNNLCLVSLQPELGNPLG